MLTTLGMILMALTGLSAAFILFVFLFGDQGTLVNITSKSGTTAVAGSPFSPEYTITAVDTTATAFATGNKLDIGLTTMGYVFIYGGMALALIFCLMLPFSPWSILERCKVCEACKQPECPPPACGCPA